MRRSLNILIFLLEGISIFAFLLMSPLSTPWLESAPGFILAFILFGAVVLLEAALARWIIGGKDLLRFIRPVLFTHLFWLFSWVWPWVEPMNLPPPHNFDLRKIQTLLGVIVISHLFAYSAWLIAKARHNGWTVSKTFGCVAAFFFIGTTLWTASVCDLSGDEPHYLLMAYSLIHDGDLDLANNYQNKDYLNFYKRGTLEPQGLDHLEKGKIFSFHPLGPALLVLPGFLLGGRLGAALIMSLLAALTLFLTMKVLEVSGAHGPPLQAVGWVGLFSSPVLLFSGLVYPEVPTAFLVILSLLLFLKKRWGWLGFCLGILLWVHNRNVLLVMPMMAVLGYEWFREGNDKWGKAWRSTVGFFIPAFLLILYFEKMYGVFTPLGAHHEPFLSLFPYQRFFTGFFGLILDQECGLWFHFPVFALMVTGGILLFRSTSPLKGFILATFCFYYLFMCFYENLGLAPATRYMVGITPLLWVMLYPAFEKIKAWDFWAKLTLGSFALGMAVNWALCAVPWIRYNKLQEGNLILILLGKFLHMPLAEWEPMFQVSTVEIKSYLLSAFWVLVTVLLSILFLKTEAKNPSEGKGS